MHKKYAQDGLVCISLSVDEAGENELKRVRDFLTKQQAHFANYLIDDPGEVWVAKLDAGPPPTVLIFGRDGKRVKKFTTMDAFTYADVEKVVAGLMTSR